MTTNERDYYGVLDVSRKADSQAIKKDYHALVMKWHLDRNKFPETEERFKETVTAYAIFKYFEKLVCYDLFLFDAISKFGVN